MDSIVTFEAPVLRASPPPDDGWEREFEVFKKLLPELLKTHRGQFVAIYQEKVVGFGDDKLKTARKAYEEFGNVVVLVREVTDEPRIVRMLTPRVVR